MPAQININVQNQASVSCPRCASRNVHFQAVGITKTRHHGILYWLFFGWLIDLLLWIFLFVPRLFIAIFGHKRVTTKVKTFAVCQNCGKQWKA